MVSLFVVVIFHSYVFTGFRFRIRVDARFSAYFFLSFLNDPWRSTGTTRGITPYFVFAQPYFVFTKPYFGFSTSYSGSSTLYPARLFPEMYGTIESYPSETTLLCPDGVIFIFTTSFRRLCSFALLLALCLRPPYSCV